MPLSSSFRTILLTFPPGIGAAICENLASKGCNLIMNYTSASSTAPATTLATSLSAKYSIHAAPIRANISTEDGVAEVIAHTLQTFPLKPTIHILINNAGIAGNSPIASITPAEFHRQYTTNVLGPLLLLRAALPYLPHDRSGRIVNISSVSSSLGFAGQSIYGGTKAALEAMTRTWARELHTRCTVNAVNPGPVKTDMYGGTTEDFRDGMRPWLEITPGAQVDEERDGEEVVTDVYGRAGKGGGNGTGNLGGRAAEAKEVAGVVGMLCGNESGWCTGSVVCANGGMRMSP